MSAEITPAPDAEQIGKELIAECHPHLKAARVLYLFTDKKRKSGGRIVLATAQKLADLPRYLSGAYANETEVDFILLIGKKEWESLTDQQQRALVDHELCHCAIGKNGWTIRAHDLEEFRAIVSRHGLWDSDLAQFSEEVIQLQLSLDLDRMRTLSDKMIEEISQPGTPGGE